MFLDFMSEVEALLKSAPGAAAAPSGRGEILGLDISPHADLASSVAFRLAVLKKSPAAIAARFTQESLQEHAAT